MSAKPVIMEPTELGNILGVSLEVATAVNGLRQDDTATLIVTHYQVCKLLFMLFSGVLNPPISSLLVC